ncbi:MAG: hypothetical protein OET57_12750, partial [Desulfobacteraceae bacterium]|nr:hypothetical protein [Desulfobacteraceae bacterium]
MSKCFHRPFASLIRGTEFAEITILLFSVERTENNKHHALRTFRTQKHRVAIDFFAFAGVSA